MIGASGAISGVLGAYVILYPRARLLSLVFLFIFIRFIYLPAWMFIGIWFLYQLLYGLATLGVGRGGVAFVAHVGGFLAGFLITLIFRRKLKRRASTEIYFR